MRGYDKKWIMFGKYFILEKFVRILLVSTINIIYRRVLSLRDQNEGLLKVVHDTTDELERMKQIFRIRGMPHQQQQQQEFNQHGTVESPQLLQQQQQQRQRSNKQQHSQGERRESVNSNNSNKSHSSKKSARGEGDPVMMPQGAMESPYLKQSDGLSAKPPKAKKSERKNRQSDDELATLDDQEAPGMADDPTDDNVSQRSHDSQQKSSSKRRSRENGHHHHSQSPRQSRHDNNNNSGSETHRRSRSRSKEGHRGSSGGGGDKIRTSNCDEQIDKKRHLNKQIYQDDCNDNIEMRQSEGGCLRVFTCCWSSPTIRSRTDDYSVDDMVLREYRE